MPDFTETLHQPFDENPQALTHRVVVIGGGPAGLMAAEQCNAAGIAVDLYDAMPSVGRKFLLAGIGGLNITHAEAYELFVARYGERQVEVGKLLAEFDPATLRQWVHQLGVETFVGSSNRVFPRDMKAAPLLRAWLHRLRAAGTRFHTRHRFLGWNDKLLKFSTPQGELAIKADAVVLALGGASWAKLGSDGAWVPWLQRQGVEIAALKPSNCGFDCNWSAHFSDRFCASPVKPVRATIVDTSGQRITRMGEFIITRHGIEGSLVYALSAFLRQAIERHGQAHLDLDLMPDKTVERVADEIGHPRGSRSLSSHLQSRAGIAGVKAGLLREILGAQEFAKPAVLAQAVKCLRLTLTSARPIDEAISTAGGVTFEAMNAHQMLNAMPGIFCAGEMLDWEAPTGGYLLTACLASGRQAGLGAVEWLRTLPQQDYKPDSAVDNR